ncbi:TonB-dependent receptor [Roseateles albus]|uniref:TonB-dependent receptor n=1 Tax=Roseateles albus TaxID=2987525 RepID=A0ABT5KJ20_9BURK|nr:TonB-dependent receptor [Roseateles albus]MDC8773509.1 TonB-dependent receptor [Roseateles albus]
MKKKVIHGLLVSSVLASSGVVAQTQTSTNSADAKKAASENASDPSQLDLVVVSGIRQSLESARNQKRNAAQFVDVVVADDIGKLPDRNVAEALSRVSGVQVDRGVGEGTNISIRGLRQNVVLFNGREVLDATGRGGTGLDQLGTSTFGIMALIPAGLISNLEVTKLAGAEQIAGGLGGVVDIRSRMPLDGAEQLAGKAGLTYDQLPGKAGTELFGLITRKFANNTLGVLASVSYDTRKLSQQGLDTFAGYRTFSDTSVTPAKTRFGNQDVRATEIQEDRKKAGFNAVLQWRPNKDFELIADTFLSKLDSTRDRFWIGFNPTSGLSNAVYSPNDILLSGRAAVPVLTNTEYADVKADVSSSALRAKYALTDSLKGTAEVTTGRATSSYHQRYMRIQPLTTVPTSVDFDLTQGSFGAFTINGVDLKDANALRQTIMFDSYFNAATDSQSVRADLKQSFDSPWIDSMEFGARYNKLDSTQNPLIADIRPAGGIPASQLGDFLMVHSNPSFASGNFPGLQRSYLVPSRDAFSSCGAFTAFPAISQSAPCLSPATQVASLASTFEVKENFTEGYAKFNFDSEVAKTMVSGNVGVRVVQRKLESIGNLINPAGGTNPASVNRTDNEVLPSAVARVNLSSDTVLRLGAAKVVAFPNTADLNNGVRLFAPVYTNGVLTVPGTGTGGSPQLNPFKANQFDLSLENYFGKQGVASLGLFKKDVSSFIIQRQIAETYSGVEYLVNRKVNGEGATVTGAELMLQLPFYFMPAPVNAFGMMATYSYIDSKTPIKDAAGRVLSFPGLSKNNVNLVGYYEEGPWSVRLALNWRDKYLVGLSAGQTGIFNDAYTDMSATMRYDFSKVVSLNLEANNLLNSELRTYDGSTEGLRNNVVFGRVYKASLSFKF